MHRPPFRRVFLSPRHWPLWFGLGVLWLLVQLPYAVLLRLGRGLGWLIYVGAHARRRIAARNLQVCFPLMSVDERRALLRENFACAGIALFETAMSWWWPHRRLMRLGHVEGLEHLERAQREGRGVILMAAHFTTLEIGAVLLRLHRLVDGMYREHKNEVFDYVQRRGRDRFGAQAEMIERDDVRAMLKALRAGRCVWYAPDQDYGIKQSIFVPLFGTPAATVTATSKFARVGRAQVIPMTQKRLPGTGGYQLVIHAPLPHFPGQSQEADCLQINQWLERAILACPEQYLWAHRRFKTRPPGAPAIYDDL